MYAMSLVRAVNGLVDPSQQGYFADSVMSIASKIGLPTWLVDLRHDATHSHLPSLSLLRSGAVNLLMWYRVHYWAKQEAFLQDQSQLFFRRTSARCSAVDAEALDGEFSSLRGGTGLTTVLMPSFVLSVCASAADPDGETASLTPQQRQKGGAVLLRLLLGEASRLEDCPLKENVVGVVVSNLVDAALSLLSQASSTCPSAHCEAAAETAQPKCQCEFTRQIFCWWVTALTESVSTKCAPKALTSVWRRHLHMPRPGATRRHFLAVCNLLLQSLQTAYGDFCVGGVVAGPPTPSACASSSSFDLQPRKRLRVDNTRECDGRQVTLAGDDCPSHSMEEGAAKFPTNSMPHTLPTYLPAERRSGWPLGSPSGCTLVGWSGSALVTVEEE